jgi:hypothetical protein
MLSFNEILESTKGIFSRAQADYIDARVLAAGVAEVHTIPADARFVIFSGTDDFYVMVDGAAAVPAADVVNGSASELNPTILDIENATTIGIISPVICTVTLTFYGD